MSSENNHRNNRLTYYIDRLSMRELNSRNRDETLFPQVQIYAQSVHCRAPQEEVASCHFCDFPALTGAVDGYTEHRLQRR